MSQINSSSDSDNTEQQKNKGGRPRKESSAWRYKADGKYDHNCATEYYKKYYHEKLAYKVQCPHCLSYVGQQKLSRHQATIKCTTARENTNNNC